MYTIHNSNINLLHSEATGIVSMFGTFADRAQDEPDRFYMIRFISVESESSSEYPLMSVCCCHV